MMLVLVYLYKNKNIYLIRLPSFLWIFLFAHNIRFRPPEKKNNLINKNKIMYFWCFFYIFFLESVRTFMFESIFSIIFIVDVCISNYTIALSIYN